MKEKREDKNKHDDFKPYSFAFELGYIITIPIVVFGLVGRFLDKKFESSPILLLLGIFIAMIISSIGIYKKVITIINK